MSITANETYGFIYGVVLKVPQWRWSLETKKWNG